MARWRPSSIRRFRRPTSSKAPALSVYAGTAQVPDASKTKEIFPNYEATQIAGTGHFLMMEKPEEFNRVLTCVPRQDQVLIAVDWGSHGRTSSINGRTFRSQRGRTPLRRCTSGRRSWGRSALSDTVAQSLLARDALRHVEGADDVADSA